MIFLSICKILKRLSHLFHLEQARLNNLITAIYLDLRTILQFWSNNQARLNKCNFSWTILNKNFIISGFIVI